MGDFKLLICKYFMLIYVSPRRYINVALFTALAPNHLIIKGNLCIPFYLCGYLSHCFVTFFYWLKMS